MLRALVLLTDSHSNSASAGLTLKSDLNGGFMAKWLLRDCNICYESGLNPENVEELCPACRGYCLYPTKLEGMALLVDWDPDYIFPSRRAAVAAVDPFYLKFC